MLLIQNLQVHQEEELEWLDNLQIQGMIQAKHQFHKLHTQSYGWMPELMRLMTELQYWQGSFWQVEGQTYNAHFLHWLAHALEPPMTPSMDSTDIICSQIATIEVKL